MAFIGHKKVKKHKFLPTNQGVELLKLKSKEIQLDNQIVYKKLSSEFVQSDQFESVCNFLIPSFAHF